MTDTSLSKKIALVTGGGRGIGKAISLALAETGCDVAVNYVSREADALRLPMPFERWGGARSSCKATLRRALDVAKLVAAVEAGLGPVDILVNNAGGATIESIDQMTEASWNDCIQLNYRRCS